MGIFEGFPVAALEARVQGRDTPRLTENRDAISPLEPGSYSGNEGLPVSQDQGDQAPLGKVQLADWIFPSGLEVEQIREVVLPVESLGDGLINLEFRMPHATISPKDVGLSDDGRRLGIGLSWVEFNGL